MLSRGGHLLSLFHQLLYIQRYVPHTLLSFLLSGAMAEELRHVDRHRDIHQIHQSAVHSLSLNADTADMIPEYRDTLRKCLIIPQPPDPSWY